MTFAAPQYYLFILIIPIILGVIWAIQHKQNRALSLFIKETLWSEGIKGKSPRRFWAKQGLRSIAIVAIIIALMQPQMGTEFKLIQRQGLDILIAMDTSLSMLAEDLKPNRLSHIKKDIHSLLTKLQGDRVGLMIFSQEAYQLTPFTTDYSAAQLFLAGVEVGQISRTGSDINALIEKATLYFESSPKEARVLILATDGESESSNLNSLIKQAKTHQIKIISVGLGKDEGEPIPIRDHSGALIEYKRNKEGAIVLSKRNTSLLSKLAKETGGEYISVGQGSIIADKLYKALSRLEKRDMENQLRQQTKHQYHIFIIIALAFILLETGIRPRSKDAK